MSYCSNCGKEVGKEDKFCMNCGENQQKGDLNQNISKENKINVENNLNNERRKIIKITIISVVVFILFLIVYKVISYYVSPERTYKEKITQYLETKYEDDFKVKFVKKRSASTYEEFSCDHSTGYIFSGINQNEKEYIFSFSPKKNTDEIKYVVLVHDELKNDYKVYETSDIARECGNPKIPENIEI